MARFRTKARTVDLLGGANISDDITAISELFKNAHDADADHAHLNVDSSSQSLLLWDDGHGMSDSEVRNKWLILGSTSKLPKRGSVVRTKEKNRVIMGEKGIGRLAVSVLGSQMLLVTKRKGKPFVAVFLHWKLFDNPKLFVEDVIIPVHTFNSIEDLPVLLGDMKTEFMTNLVDNKGSRRRVWTGYQGPLGLLIEHQVDQFQLGHPELATYFDDLVAKDQGTLFFIQGKTDTDWRSMVTVGESTKRTNERKKRIQMMLTYFENSLAIQPGLGVVMQRNSIDPFTPSIIVDGHRDWVSPFKFEPTDLELFDYKICGQVKYGHFTGFVETQGQEPNRVHWSVTHGMDIEAGIHDCGPFDIYIQVIEGMPKDSQLSKEEHDAMRTKLREIGGLYVYRDGMRVLPYGTPENDFLRIEERRSKDLGEAVLSLRRMYGYITITKEGNPELVDKTNREGLRENAQAQYFTDCLQNLLTRWTSGHLNKGIRDQHKVANQDRKAREQEQERLEKERDRDRKAYLRQITQSRPKLVKELGQAAKTLLAEIRERIPSVDELASADKLSEGRSIATYANLVDQLTQVNHASHAIRSKIHDLAVTYVLENDPRFRDQDEVDTLFHGHLSSLATTQTSLYDFLDSRRDEATEWLERCLSSLSAELTAQIGTPAIKDFVESLDRQSLDASRNVADVKGSLQRMVRQELDARAEYYLGLLATERRAVDQAILEQTNATLRSIEQVFELPLKRAEELRSLFEQIQRLNTTDNHLRDLIERFQSWHHGLVADMGNASEQVSAQVLPQARALAVPRLDALAQRGVTEEVRLVALYDARIRTLEKELEGYRGLAATGLASELLDHEYENHYDRLHDIFDDPEFEVLAEDTHILRDIRDTFGMIEKTRNLLNPVYRKSRFSKEDLNLHELGEKMRSFFANSLKLHRIDFQNDIPEDFFIREAEPIVYPAFLNIIKNSLFWLLDSRQRVVRLRVDESGSHLYLEDSGSGIDVDRAPHVFDLFYSTKLGGRGLGLHLAKDLLNSRKHEITCITDPSEKSLLGACFRITFNPASILR